MQGSAERIVNDVLGNIKQINIPVYQRRYSWRREQLVRFVDDLRMAFANHRDKYFFGSLILDASSGGLNTVAVIDGQQRLTTVSLFLIAIRDMLGQDDEEYDRINEEYLINKFDKVSVAKNRLHSVPGDEEQYIDVLRHGAGAAESLFLETYAYFYDVLNQDWLSVTDWLQVLEERLQVMNIVVNQDDDAQLIFESLNSTGMSLTESDKIRNYLLMSLHGDKQQEAFDLWRSNERLVPRGELSKFYRHYLSSLAMTSKPIKEAEIYDDYRRYVGGTESFDRLAQLKKENTVAKIYATIANPQQAQFDDPRIKSLLVRIGHLNNDILYPYFLQIFAKFRDGELSANQMTGILQVILAYLARRLFVGIPTTGLNQLFVVLDRQVVRYAERNQLDYVQALKLVLTKKVKRNKLFPTDAELEAALQTKDYYHISYPSLWFILDELNNAEGEHQSLFERAQEGTYSVEHIMPQHLTMNWRGALGSEWESIYHDWENRLANLTLTGFNGQMSNKAFLEKRDMPDGYDKSGIKLNQWIAKHDHWSADTMAARENYLFQRALAVWPRPEVPDIDESDSDTSWDTLDVILQADPTGTKPAAYSFGDDHDMPIGSWRGLYNRIVNALWNTDPTNFFALANSDNSLVQHKDNLVPGKKYRQLGNTDIYVSNEGSNSWNRVSHIKSILEGCGHDLSEVSVKTYETGGKGHKGGAATLPHL